MTFSDVFNIYLLFGFGVVGIKYEQLVKIQTQVVQKDHKDVYDANPNTRDLIICMVVLLYIIVWPLFVKDLTYLEKEEKSEQD